MIVYDIEVYRDLFVAVFQKTKEQSAVIFEISSYKDDRGDLLQYLKKNRKSYYIGYNNRGYDDQILHHMMLNPEITTEEIKEFSDQVINSKWGIYSAKDNTTIPKSIDLMQVNNYGIYGKNVSLKQIAFNLRQSDLQDLPIHHSAKVNTQGNIKKVIKYCLKDVDRTKKFFEISKGLLVFRRDLGKLMNLDIISDSEVTLVKKVFARIFSKELGIPEWEVKKMRTYRDKIILSEFLPKVEFETQDYQEFYNFYRDL